MQSVGWAKIGIHYAKDDVYSHYYREALEHAGLRAEAFESVSINELGRVDVLLLCGYGKLSENQVKALSEWVYNGGSLVCSGSGWGFSYALGLDERDTRLSNATITPFGKENDRLWPDETESIRFFGGCGKRVGSAETIANANEQYVAVARKRYGDGLAIFVGPHVGQTMALMQNGRSVDCDGIGPNDGSAILDDGNLRAEDGVTLSFENDRTVAPGCDAPFFGQAHSDALRDLWVRAILNAVDHTGRATQLFWHWPHGRDGAATVTMDCENFDTDHVNRIHRMMNMFGCRGTWLVAMPGYSADVYRTMRTWEHEIGVLFHTDNQHGWHEERFKIEHTSISRLSGMPNMISARCADGKWKGWLNFYQLCESAGARLSLSKGGRQPGTQGFLFGTCHLYFPQKRDGQSYHVAELPYTMFLPGTIAHDKIIDQIALETRKRHGCFHLVLTPESILDPQVSASLRRVLSIAKQSRFEFFTADQIYRFEKTRRQLRIFQKHVDTDKTLLITSENPIEGLTLLISGSRVEAQLRGKPLNTQAVKRYGTEFTAVELDLQPKHQADLHFKPMVYLEAA